MSSARTAYGLVACVACLLWAAIASAQTFTSIDFPGGFDTQPTAITPSGIIVGRYCDTRCSDPNRHMHGFVLAAGKYVSVDAPNGGDTELNWIDPSGDIVGDFFGTDGRLHGFLLSGGKFRIFEYPGAVLTFAFGINPSGDIVGTQLGPDSIYHGYLLTKQGKFSSIDFPGAPATFASMINQKSIVGFYLSATGSVQSYLLTSGAYQTITCPDWDPVVLTSLTPQGDMTGGGTYLLDARQHGVVVSNGKCSAIDFPGSVGKDYVNSMNPQGDLVGTYQTPDGDGHGYLRTKH